MDGNNSPPRKRVSTRDTLLFFLNDGFRKFLTGRKADAILFGNFDGLAVAGIDAFASSAPAHFERAKTNQAYFVTLFQRLANGFQGNFEYLSSLLLRQARLGSDAFGDL